MEELGLRDGQLPGRQWSNGKLRSASRHNRIFIPGTSTEIDLPVEESYFYDGVGGRISSVTTRVLGLGNPDPPENSQPAFSYSLAYDPLGNVSSRTQPRCTFNFCTGSSANPLRAVSGTFTQGLLTAVPGYAPAVSYHSNGLVAQVTHANGVADLQEKDPEDMARPLRLRTSGASDNFDTGGYAFDGAGNVTKMGSDRFLYDLLSRIGEAQVEVPGTGCGQELMLDSGTDSGTVTHQSCGTVRAEGSYKVGATGNVTLRAGNRVVLGDGFSVASGGRLTALTDPALDLEGEPTEASQSYTFDRFGNLLTIETEREGESPVTRTIGTSSATNRLTVANYDLSGNVTTWAGREYRYDPFNMLWQTKPTSGNGVTFLYGPGDERLWTIDWTAGAGCETWVETWTLRDFDGTPLRQFRSGGCNDATADWSFHRDYVYRGGALLAAHTPEGLQHFHLDHLGSPRIITDANGKTVAEHLYFPFGEEATNPAQGAEALRFTGHERDELDAGGTTADLDYMHARYFSAHLGRFNSIDPVGGAPNWPQSWNRYSYTLGNPLKYTDPEGLWPFFLPLGDLPLWDEITVIGQLISLQARPYNPFTGVSGLGSLISGRGFLNSLQGAGGSFIALAGWATGTLPRTGVATPEMATQLANTPGMENIREEYRQAGCRDGRYSSDFQYRELVTTTNVTGQLVGGFVADITSAGGGMVVVNAQNTWGLESATRFPGVGNRGNASVQQMLSGSGRFQYPKSLLENRAHGPMGTATLHYIWAEASPCP